MIPVSWAKFGSSLLVFPVHLPSFMVFWSLHGLGELYSHVYNWQAKLQYNGMTE